MKPQKTNLNVRLNNIGGGISKLNIQIDWFLLIFTILIIFYYYSNINKALFILSSLDI